MHKTTTREDVVLAVFAHEEENLSLSLSFELYKTLLLLFLLLLVVVFFFFFFSSFFLSFFRRFALLRLKRSEVLCVFFFFFLCVCDSFRVLVSLSFKGCDVKSV